MSDTQQEGKRIVNLSRATERDTHRDWITRLSCEKRERERYTKQINSNTNNDTEKTQTLYTVSHRNVSPWAGCKNINQLNNSNAIGQLMAAGIKLGRNVWAQYDGWCRISVRSPCDNEDRGALMPTPVSWWNLLITRAELYLTKTGLLIYIYSHPVPYLN